MKIQKISKISGGAILSGGMLLLLALAMVCPFAKEEVRAADCKTDPNQEECIKQSSVMGVAVNLEPTLSIALDSTVQIELAPKSTGEFTSGSANLVVSTNSRDGYAVFMKTGNGTQNLTSDDGRSGVFQPLAGEKTAEEFPVNTWGYAIGDEAASSETKYKAVPGADGAAILSREATGGNDHYKLDFGVKADTTMAAGSYSNSVIVSAVANPLIITNLNQAKFMQDMTSEVCEKTHGLDGAQVVATGQEPSKQLIDQRDGKRYWVTKLADQNCWMTQNLGLTFGTGENEVAKLTPADSDVTTEWAPKHMTLKGLVFGESRDGSAQSSWDLGNYVITKPRGGDCPGSITSGTAISDCPSSFEEVNSASNTHYQIGNYYQWDVATAGTGMATNAAAENNEAAKTDPAKLNDATSSICPKGWMLPLGGDAEGTNLIFDRGKSYFNLAKAYGYRDSGDPAWERGVYGVAANIDDGTVRFDESPFYLARAGFIDPEDSVETGIENFLLGNLSTGGYLRTATAVPGTAKDAFQWFIYGTGVFSSVLKDFGGESVRCVAR